MCPRLHIGRTTVQRGVGATRVTTPSGQEQKEWQVTTGTPMN